MRAELARRKIVQDPVKWASHSLNTFLWSKQRQIIRSIVDNPRTSVRSCHSSGKSRIAATAVLWWLKRYPPGEAFVITTAPTNAQVRTILWREIGHLFDSSGLKGSCNQTEIKLQKGSKEHIVAFGRKPADLDDSAFQGIHARNVLIVLDEASGVPRLIWDAAESIISGGHGRLLAIGNPTQAGTEFHKTFRKRSGFNNIHIAARHTPNFTDEEVPDLLHEVLINQDWVDRMRVKWGEDNPIFGARVNGEFPDVNEFGFFPSSLLREAYMLVSPGSASQHRYLGCDIGAGGDPSVFCLREGQRARIIEVNYEPNTEKTGKRIAELLKKYNATALIDNIGVGHTSYLTAKQLAPGKVFPVDFRNTADDPENYHDRKAELYSAVRDRLVEGTLDLDEDDEELADEFACIDARTDAGGRIKIEDKDQIRKRLGHSTDRLDALSLTFGKHIVQGMPSIVGKRDDVLYN